MIYYVSYYGDIAQVLPLDCESMGDGRIYCKAYGRSFKLGLEIHDTLRGAELAAIAKAEKRIASLEKQIAKLRADIAGWQQ